MFYEFEGGWLNTDMIVTMYAGITDDTTTDNMYAIHMQTLGGITKAKGRYKTESETKSEIRTLMTEINKSLKGE